MVWCKIKILSADKWMYPSAVHSIISPKKKKVGGVGGEGGKKEKKGKKKRKEKVD